MVEISRLRANRSLVMLARAGSVFDSSASRNKTLIPACAEMTEARVDFQSTNLTPVGSMPRAVWFY